MYTFFPQTYLFHTLQISINFFRLEGRLISLSWSQITIGEMEADLRICKYFYCFIIFPPQTYLFHTLQISINFFTTLQLSTYFLRMEGHLIYKKMEDNLLSEWKVILFIRKWKTICYQIWYAMEDNLFSDEIQIKLVEVGLITSSNLSAEYQIVFLFMKYHLISDDLPIFSKFLNADMSDLPEVLKR